jgi:hypothetical protein
MTLRLWLETTHHAAFRYGGWAYAGQAGDGVTGRAGGERNLTAARLDLCAMVAAFESAPPGSAVAMRTSNPALLAIARMMTSPPVAGSPDAPTDDLDQWARLLSAARGRALTFAASPRGPKTAAAFLGAWAEVGQDKAKTVGRFSAVIPKSNLAKLTLD